MRFQPSAAGAHKAQVAPRELPVGLQMQHVSRRQSHGGMTQLHEVCLDLAEWFAIVQPEDVMGSSV